MPDEEVGGSRGIRELLGSERIHKLNGTQTPVNNGHAFCMNCYTSGTLIHLLVGFVLDEGLASPSDKFSVFYGERKIWWIRLKAVGPAGHGSRFIPYTAVAQLTR